MLTQLKTRSFRAATYLLTTLLAWAAGNALANPNNFASVTSLTTTVSPVHPLPGDSYTVTVALTGGVAKPCFTDFTASIPGVPSLPAQTRSSVRVHNGQPQRFSFTFQLPGAIAADTDLTPSISYQGCGGPSTVSGLPSGTTPPSVKNVGTPALSIIKQLAPGSSADVVPGDLVAYRVTVKSVGSATASGITITDALDSRFQFQSVTSPGVHNGTNPGGQISWSIGALDVGSSRSYDYVVKVLDSAPAGPIDNTAQVQASGVSPLDSSAVRVTVHREPKILLDKFIDDDSTRSAVREAGRQVSYRVHYRNVGFSAAEKVVVTDTLSPALIGPYTLSGGRRTSNVSAGGVVTWDVGNVQPGQSATLVVTGQIDPSTSLDNFDNTATAKYENASGTEFTSTSPQTNITIVDEPYLTLSKAVVPPVVAPGDPLYYTIGYRNIGTVNAVNPTVEDILPAGVTPVSGSYSTSIFDAGTGRWTLVWDNLKDLPPAAQDSYLSYKVTVDPGVIDTTLVNDARMGADNLPGFVHAVASASAQVRGEPDLQPSKRRLSNQSIVADGDQIRYGVKVRNGGVERTDGNVTLTDRLPLGLDFVSASGGGVYDAGTRTVTWTVAQLQPGAASGEFELTVEVDGSQWRDGQPIPNRVTATANDQYGRSYIKTSDPVLVQYNLPPQITLTKTAVPDTKVPLKAGDIVFYSINAKLDTYGGVSDLVFVDTLPPELEYLDSPTPGVTTSTDAAGNTQVTWPAQAVGQAGANVLVRARVRSGLPLGQAITNQASASWTGGTAVALPVTHYVSSAAMTLEKTVSTRQQNVIEGELVTFNLTLRNTGNIQLTGLELIDALPTGLTFDSASSTPKSNTPGPAARVLAWDLKPLDPGQSTTLLVRATVDAGTLGSQLINTATAVSDSTQPVSDDADVLVREAPQLVLEKTPSIVVAHPGDFIDFTLKVSNAGSGDAVNLILYDLLPSELGFDSASDGQTADANGLVSWNIGTLKPGQSATKHVIAQVPAGAIATPLQVNNLALAVSDKDAAIRLAPLTLQELPAFTVSKQVSGGNAPGDVLHYSIEVLKTGGPATSVKVSDSLPPFTQYVAGSSSEALDNLSNPSGGTLIWDLGNFPAGPGRFSVSFDVQLDAVIPNNTDIINYAHLSAAEIAGVDSNQAVVTISSAPVLSLIKRSSTQQAVGPDRPLFSAVTGNPDGLKSDTVTFTLEALNSGNAVASQVTLVDRLPAELTLTSVPKGATVSGQEVSWNLGDLPPGQPVSVTLTARLDNDLADGYSLSNAAVLKTQTAGIGDIPSNTIDMTVRGEPVLQLLKSVGNPAPKAGELLTYTLTLQNTGTATSGNLVIEDLLKGPVSFHSADHGGAETAPGSRRVRWNLPPLAAGAQHQVSLTVQLDSVITNGTSLDNRATAFVSGNPGLSVGSLSPGGGAVVTSAPLLKIEKRNITGPSQAAGKPVTWEITVSNIGSDTATGVEVIDNVPTGTRLIAAPNASSVQGNRVQWQLNTLAAKSSATFTLITELPLGLSNGKVVTNSASVRSIEQPLPIKDSASVKVLSANLKVSKSADRARVASGVSTTSTPGGVVTYSLSFTNAGGAEAATVELVDELPVEVTFLDASPAPDQISGQRLTWNFSNIAPQASGSVSIRVRASDDLRDGLVLQNTAFASAPGVPQVAATPVDVLVTSAPSLTLVKSSQVTTAAPGQTVSYSLTVENIGSDRADQVVLTDTLPAEMTLVDDGGATVSGSNLTWNLGSIGPGASATVHVKGQLASVLADGTPVVNRATVTAQDRNANPLPTLSDRYALTVSSAPILQLSYVSAPSSVAAGGGGSYTLRISNTGNAIANGVEVAAVLPTDMVPLSIDKSGTFITDVLTGYQFAYWSIGSLPPAGFIDLTFTGSVPVGAPSGETLLSLAAIEASNAPPTVALALARVDSAPALSLTKSVAGSAQAGSTVSYQLDYFNGGNGTASAVTLSDTLPPGTSFLSASAGGTESGGVVTWSLGDLAALAGGTLSVQVAVDNGLADNTLLSNIAAISASNNPPAVASASTRVRSHTELDVDISPASATVAAGDQQVFTLTWGNSGNQSTSNARISATLPPNTSFVSGTDGASVSSGVVTWPVLATLGAGVSGSYQFTVATDSPLTDGLVLKSVAAISADSGLPDSDTAKFAIHSQPVLVGSKSASASSVLPGATLEFVIRLSNLGNEDAAAVSVVDQLPDGLVLISADGGGVVDVSNNRVTWSVGALPVGASERVFRVQARVGNVQGELTNRVTVSATRVPDQDLSVSVSAVLPPPTPVPLFGRSSWWLVALMLGLLMLMLRAQRERQHGY